MLVDADAIFFRQSGGSPCVTHNPDDTNSTRRTSPLDNSRPILLIRVSLSLILDNTKNEVCDAQA